MAMSKKELRLQLEISRNYILSSFYKEQDKKIYTDDLGNGIQTLDNGKVKYVNETKKANVAHDKQMKIKIPK